MAGLNVSMLTAQNALAMRQVQLAITGNNIANADNADYHKQEAQVLANTPLETSYPGQIGTGANVETVVRAYDIALENSLRQATSQEGYYNAYTREVVNTENILAPDGESSIAMAMSDFADSLQQLATNPEASSSRTIVLQMASELASQVNLQRSWLTDLRDGIADGTSNSSLTTVVSEVNSITTQIADLNNRILEVESRSFNEQNANDYRDQRDALVLELSELMEIDVVESNTGYDISLAGTSDYLVQAGVSNDIGQQLTSTATGPELTWAASGTVIATQTTGKAQGLIDAYAYVQSNIDKLDTFSTELADTVNTQHALGFDLDGNAGTDIFDASTPGSLKVLITDPDDVAAASIAGQSGNGDNALAIWTQLDTVNAALSGTTLLGYNDMLVNDAASATAEAGTMLDASSSGVMMYKQAISSVSGVNMDEEMMNLLEIQRAYQASAKFMNIIDQMLNQALSMV